MSAITDTTITDNFVAVTASATSANNTNLDSKIRLTDHPTVQSTGYIPAANTGLATDGYVKDYVHSILEWETIV